MFDKNKMYNGHKNWNCWNISLWISNDYGLYTVAMDVLKEHPKNLNKAANDFMEYLKAIGKTKTLDGAKYTREAVLLALKGLRD